MTRDLIIKVWDGCPYSASLPDLQLSRATFWLGRLQCSNQSILKYSTAQGGARTKPELVVPLRGEENFHSSQIFVLTSYVGFLHPKLDM